MSLKRPMLAKQYDPKELFRDGPRPWTIVQGKLGERPSSGAREAVKERDATPFRQRLRGNHLALLRGKPTATSIGALAFADKLDVCPRPERPFDRSKPKGLGR
jgi:hypothetical protein